MDVPAAGMLVFRPHHASFSAPDTTPAAGRARILGTVSFVEFLGAIERYGVAVGDQTVLVDVAHGLAPEGLGPGSPVALDVATDRVLVLAA
jgi:hypothetical protein